MGWDVCPACERPGTPVDKTGEVLACTFTFCRVRTFESVQANVARIDGRGASTGNEGVQP